MPQARKKLFFITALTARQAMALVMVRGLENPGRAGRRTRWQMRRLREAVVAAGLEDAVGWLAQVAVGEVAMESEEEVAELGALLDKLLAALGW